MSDNIISIHVDNELNKQLNNGELALVSIADIHKLISYCKSNMFADSIAELEDQHNIDLYPIDIEADNTNDKN